MDMNEESTDSSYTVIKMDINSPEWKERLEKIRLAKVAKKGGESSFEEDTKPGMKITTYNKWGD
jgi:hypothetical protein